MERGILAWIVIGLVAGGLAKLIMPGRDPGGLIVTMLLGIGGSILGGWLWSLLTASSGPAHLIGSVIGAIILLAIYRAFVGRRKRV